MNITRTKGLTIASLTAVAIGVVVAVLLASSGDADEDFGSPDIRGEITPISGTTLLIEGAIEADTGFDKASVRTDGDTEILWPGDDGDLLEIEFEELEVGQVVEVWFEGPVAESYPVQAYGARIVVLN